MSEENFFRIGSLGVPWGDTEKASWKAEVGIAKRSYKEDVLNKLDTLKENFDVEQYGALSENPDKYPLFCIRTRNFPEAGAERNDKKPCILVTGGVHGYEKSGVQGALLFAQEKMLSYADRFHILVCPCVSPWGYECIQRWSPSTVDPNRSFYDTPEKCLCEEGAALKKLVDRFGLNLSDESLNISKGCLMHTDLHETTDTDASEFRPAKAARDGETKKPNTHIPDGFYLVGDTPSVSCSEGRNVVAWYNAIMDAVREVTHLAPPDSEGNILGEPVRKDAEATITLPTRELHLCASVTRAPFAVTTEVYPDSTSRNVTEDQCNRAQMAVVVGGLDFLANKFL